MASAFVVVFGGTAARLFADGEDVPDHQPTTPPAVVDVGDLWHFVRHHDFPPPQQPEAMDVGKRFFVLAPTVTSKPTTGLSVGASSNLAFINGDADTTHISSISMGAKVSQKQQVLSGAKLGIFTDGDRWFVLGDNRAYWTSLGAFALGGESTAATSSTLKYDQFRVFETAYRRVAERVFVGVGLDYSNHTNVRTPSQSPADLAGTVYGEYSKTNGFDPAHQVSAGTNFGVLVDTRDSAINASRGWLTSATYRTYFGGFLGGSSTWQELYLDARTYRRLTHSGRQKLAFWFIGDLVTGGTAPYFDLPTTGADGRSARGYGEGRFRGPQLLYGEVEYRTTITRNDLIGAVAFLNTTTVSGDEPGQDLFNSFAPGAGLGLRVLLNKHSKTNLCVDYGWGKQGSRGLYLSIQEAF